MSDWNPSLYLHFAAERSRPAVELLARVPLENIEYIADLGCGPGNSTALLHQRWPAARITGIDCNIPSRRTDRYCWHFRVCLLLPAVRSNYHVSW